MSRNIWLKFWEKEGINLGITRGGVANALDHVCAPVSKQLPETPAKSEKEGGKN